MSQLPAEAEVPWYKLGLPARVLTPSCPAEWLTTVKLFYSGAWVSGRLPGHLRSGGKSSWQEPRGMRPCITSGLWLWENRLTCWLGSLIWKWVSWRLPLRARASVRGPGPDANGILASPQTHRVACFIGGSWELCKVCSNTLLSGGIKPQTRSGTKGNELLTSLSS